MEGICEDTSRLVVSTMVSIQKSIEFVAKRRMRTRARVNTRTGVDTGIVVLVGWRDIATSKGGLHQNRKPKLGCELTETKAHTTISFFESKKWL